MRFSTSALGQKPTYSLNSTLSEWVVRDQAKNFVARQLAECHWPSDAGDDAQIVDTRHRSIDTEPVKRKLRYRGRSLVRHTAARPSSAIIISHFSRASEGAPAGVGPFQIATKTDGVVAEVGAGLDWIGHGGTELKLFYEGRIGDLVSEQSGGVKASVPF